MTAIRLDRRLILENGIRVSDGAGGFASSWVSVGELWAEVRPGGGREVGGEEQVLTSVAYRITVRAAPVGNARRPVPGQRFRDGGRTFAIQAVAEWADLYLTCFALEEEPV